MPRSGPGTSARVRSTCNTSSAKQTQIQLYAQDGVDADPVGQRTVLRGHVCASCRRDMLRRSPRRSTFADDNMQLLPLPEPEPGARRRRPAGSDLCSALGNCADALFLGFLQVQVRQQEHHAAPA